MRSLGRNARTKRRLALPAPKKMAGSASSKKKCFSIIGRNGVMKKVDEEKENTSRDSQLVPWKMNDYCKKVCLLSANETFHSQEISR